MSIDIAKFRPLIALALDAAKKVGGNSPAFLTVLNGLSSVTAGVPELTQDKAALDAAIAGRQASSQRVKEAFRKKP